MVSDLRAAMSRAEGAADVHGGVVDGGGAAASKPEKRRCQGGSRRPGDSRKTRMAEKDRETARQSARGSPLGHGKGELFLAGTE